MNDRSVQMCLQGRMAPLGYPKSPKSFRTRERRPFACAVAKIRRGVEIRFNAESLVISQFSQHSPYKTNPFFCVNRQPKEIQE